MSQIKGSCTCVSFINVLVLVSLPKKADGHTKEPDGVSKSAVHKGHECQIRH